MNPNIGLALAEIKQQSHHFLEGVGLEVEQNEEQLVFHLRQGRFAPPTVRTLALFLFDEVLFGKGDPGLFKVRYQLLEFIHI